MSVVYESLEKFNEHTYIALHSDTGKPMILKAAGRFCEPRIWQALAGCVLPGIPTYLGRTRLAQDEQMFCFEYLAGVNILDYVQRYNFVQRQLFARLVAQKIICILQQAGTCCRQALIHGDIKSEHVFISKSQQLFIVDWEQARFTNQQYLAYGVNAYYSAPEILSGDTSIYSDLYSLAKLEIAIICGKPLQLLTKGDYANLAKYCTFPNFYRIRSGLQINPQERIPYLNLTLADDGSFRSC